MMAARLYHADEPRECVCVCLRLSDAWPETIRMITSYRPGGGDTIRPRQWQFDLRRVRSPHISGGRPAAGSQRADSLGSCATQPAFLSLGWDYGSYCLGKLWKVMENRERQGILKVLEYRNKRQTKNICSK